jgi:hypothetical protein
MRAFGNLTIRVLGVATAGRLIYFDSSRRSVRAIVFPVHGQTVDALALPDDVLDDKSMDRVTRPKAQQAFRKSLTASQAPG